MERMSVSGGCDTQSHFGLDAKLLPFQDECERYTGGNDAEEVPHRSSEY